MKKQELVSLWGDTVGVTDLVRSIILSIVLTMGGYFIAPTNQPTQQLFFGLLGAVLSFILNSFLVKPKRRLESFDQIGEE
ncbi:hypothetical protein [Vagococcus sp.]|uniref:hypothetical protein n=1 Tax=Vagococcus sp. TaxID=1933889 RepID=UPI003F99C462